ncbi:DUF2520 domain-containing protein [Amphiplicatus metriothermophilus]|uniref:Predicted oxidoreductase, contains short-chain dehydrogenase (SDR) and DUF2520 domains n=1 Tax=Amphiplicatus metriothermophilus TaxID=1519374 RepID=A0A239PUS5_9PROT|nr:DUF2520 domain-containing protein [Amphiplicatus metriothermophilus]MBB5519468.1 putative short-subunit dehydrogenase-like oxidoreductase (DUF2520 family) [Amphiplicatus metriothermophilus]SNT73682.1 Predicted oxidoreductase, contains short-chain dehydrogenase (SDR) and DUF2520 domains [Amphiplicatus metriothermophilus]
MKYAIIGTGRVAQSIAAYLRALNHEAALIARAESEARAPSCLRALAAADVIAAAIPDRALGPWRQAYNEAVADKLAIHFSGALLIEGMWSYHPLYSFPPAPLPPETTARVAFARQEGAPPLGSLVPGAKNPEFVVPDADRAFYHALAVLSGNFAAFLWNETAKAFSGRLSGAPANILAGYLHGVVDRFAESPFDSLTGPIARRDRATVEANLAALAREPRLAGLYRAFLAAAWPDFEPGNAAGDDA